MLTKTDTFIPCARFALCMYNMYKSLTKAILMVLCD